MEREAKVVSLAVARQLDRGGWMHPTELAWFRNSEGWSVMLYPEARELAKIRQAHRHLAYGCVVAPDVSELLTALRPDSQGIQVLVDDHGVRVTLRPHHRDSTPVNLSQQVADTLPDALAMVWIAMREEHRGPKDETQR